MTFPVHELERFRRVARDLSELKRLYDNSTADSVAERLFRRAWKDISAGIALDQVWPACVADALVATQLAGIDADVLEEVGVHTSARSDILSRGYEYAVSGLSPERLTLVKAAVVRPGLQKRGAEPPRFVDALIRQPRAGATSPGKPRLTVQPAESHGDHCLVVAVLGALVALHDGADPGRVFLAGLAHHLHNAALPDTGFAGEMMLGTSLEPIMEALFSRELATLPPAPEALTRDALLLIADAETPEGRAFHASDVIDRVLQAHHHARAAAFTADQALHDLELVHEGPLQPFQKRVLAAMDLV